MVYIYTLEHPITGQIRYVGKTKNLKERYKNHCNKLHNKHSHKRNWITSLKNQKLKPIMKVIDNVDDTEWKYWEKFWIEQCRQWGFNLVNHTSGGDGLTSGNQTSFKKGCIPWNYGTAKPKILKGNRGKVENCIKNHFKQGHEPWNKGAKGYKTSRRKPVLQFDLQGNFIKEWESCLEAATEYNCSRNNIENACNKRSKTARGYKWEYK